MRILVVAAHPDDETLGCGGTITKLTASGHEVHVAILSEGRGDIAAVQAQGREAAQVLGVKEVVVCGLPDQVFDTLPLLDVVKVIEGLLEKVGPTTVFTHHGGDLNLDHQIVHRAVLTAARPMTGSSVRSIYAYEVPSSSDWAFHRFEPVFQPNFFVDISETLDTKLAALAKYEAEAREFPHPRSSEAIRAAALRWGSSVGCPAAEAFELILATRLGSEVL